MVTVGSGEYRYKRVDDWPKMPKYWAFSWPTDAAVNSHGEIYVLSREDKHPITIWDKQGNFVSSWGEGAFSPMPHGIYIAPNDNVWVVDRDYHIVSEFSPGGDLLRTLGNRLSPSPTWHGRFIKSVPFNMPANVAVSPNGFIYVADGYGNQRVHKFSPEGELVHSWGKQGQGPGEFALVHNIDIDKHNRILVCDDENHRIQLFNSDGEFLEQWEMTNPSGICIHNDIVYVAQLGPYLDPEKSPGWGSVSLWNLDGICIASWTGMDGGKDIDVLFGPHDLCVDDEGSIYVCEGDVGRVSKFVRI